MSLTDDLHQLDERRDSGEIGPEEYQAEKGKLLDACVGRIENWSPPTGPRRIMPRVVRGTARSLTFTEVKESATLWLGEQKVTLRRLKGPISISSGDQVLVGGTVTKGVLAGSFYINESNGDNSVEESRSTVRQSIAAGALMAFGSVAVLVTVAIAALREPMFLSASGVVRTVMYLISVGAALTLGVVALFFLWAGGFQYKLIRMIDEKHVVAAKKG